jgi:DNA polymerase-3 subunit gamma/tau
MINLYRKYRPKKFSQLIGQDEIKEILISELKNKKVSHAYLFAGMRGCGKTTTARILSKALNCLEPEDSYEPCQKCDNCKAIDSGSFPDVIEMDAASNRGIDEIRSIKEGVNFIPAIGKYKIYIIDEVHMLTQQAFNALLKTLEEPPEHTVFILATTEINKVPQTIVSRCQVLSFKPHTMEDVVSNLKYISDGEGFSYEEEALRLIAKKGEGSMRDSIGILEQVAIYSSGNLTKSAVLELLGDVEEELLDQYIKEILDGRKSNIGSLLDKVYISGKNLEIFLKDLIYRLNERIESGEELYKLLSFFATSYKDMVYFFDKKIFIKAKTFELIDILHETRPSVSSGQNVSEISERSLSDKETVDKEIIDELPIEEKNDEKEIENEVFEEKENEDVDAVEVTDDHKVSEDKAFDEPKSKEDYIEIDLEKKNEQLPDDWNASLEKLKEKNIALYTLISKASVDFSDGKIILSYPANENFSYETIIGKLDYVKEILKKYGFEKEMLVVKGEKEFEKMPEEIKSILKLFGGTIERE